MKNICKRLGAFFVVASLISCGQQPTARDLTEVETAVAFIKEYGYEDFAAQHKKQSGKTPYDFGMKLLLSGKGDEAKEWFSQLGIATESPKLLFGLAYVRWKTGDNANAIKDCRFLLQERNAGPKLRARTQYLLGSILVDERDFAGARAALDESLDLYKSLSNMHGGQYLALSMKAWVAVVSGEHDEVEPLLDKGMKQLGKLKKDVYGKGRYYETLAEMYFVQGDYENALAKAVESQKSYFNHQRTFESEMMRSKVALCLLLTGKPKKASKLASQLWGTFNNKPEWARAAAYNEITLAKLDQCSQKHQDKEKRLAAARAWAGSAAGGKALLELLNFVMDREKAPCPEWEVNQ